MDVPLSSIRDRIKAIPKTETHLHIEGALPYELLRELDPERFPKEPDFRKANYRYASFVEFENLLIEHAVAWYTGPERYHQACKRIFEGLAAQNVKYVETSIHLPMIEFTGSDGDELVSAVKSAAPEGLIVRVVGGMTRNCYTETMRPVIESLHRWEALDGIDLHGQEWLELESWTAPVWRRCKEAGKIIKVHAGEFQGPESVRVALDLLGAERIQHGVRAVEDPDLVQRLSAEGVILDICPISNEKLKVVSSLEEHPIASLLDAGVACTVSTDDPLCFANTITDEYEALVDRLGFDGPRLALVAKNGFRQARMDDAEKRSYMSEIDRLLEC